MADTSRIIFGIRQSKSERGISEGTTRSMFSILWEVKESTTLCIISVLCFKKYFLAMSFSEIEDRRDFEDDRSIASDPPMGRQVGRVTAAARFNVPAIDRALEEAADNLDIQLGIYGIQFAERSRKPSTSEQQEMLLTLHLLRRQASERDLKATLKKIANAEKALAALEKLRTAVHREEGRRQRYRVKAW